MTTQLQTLPLATCRCGRPYQRDREAHFCPLCRARIVSPATEVEHFPKCSQCRIAMAGIDGLCSHCRYDQITEEERRAEIARLDAKAAQITPQGHQQARVDEDHEYGGVSYYHPEAFVSADRPKHPAQGCGYGILRAVTILLVGVVVVALAQAVAWKVQGR